jgi:chromosome segregation ATPase
MRIIATSILLRAVATSVLLAVGCGGGASSEAPPVGRTEITAASSPATIEDVAKFRRERDEARQQLAMMQTAFAERQRNDEAIMRAMQDRDATADGALRNLELADKEIDSLVDKLGKASGAQRAKLERTLRDLTAKRSALARELRALLQTATPAAIEAMKPRVDAAIEDLVSTSRARDNGERAR